MKNALAFLSVVAVMVISGCNGHNLTYKEGKDIAVSNALVVSAHPEASRAGAAIMAKGGNAVDAAAAVEFALAVCFPSAGNIGGGGFMVIRLSDGTVDALDYREKAPAASHQDMFLDENGKVLDSLCLNSHLSAGVPGTVDGVITAQKRYGRLTLAEVIQPAIELATSGFPLTEAQAASLNYMKKTFMARNSYNVAYVREAEWKAGDTLKQPELGATLARIKDFGRDGFYEGVTAEMIIAECKRGNGIISAEDLKEYRSVWRKPIMTDYRGCTIVSMPPPSSGGILLSQILTMISIKATGKGEFMTSSEIHLMAEAERRAYADRAQYLGDPAFVDIPVEGLLNREYLAERMKNFDPGKATPSDSIIYGNPFGYESEETTHYSIVDQYGNAVAGTTTLNNSYGSAIVVNGAGFILNDQMDDFSAKPGSPNLYGLIGGKANAVEPGKRMLSSMTPTIIEKNNGLFMVLGSPGGSTIPTTVCQVIRNVVDYGMNISQAVNAPRFHHQWIPDVIMYEKNGIDSAVIEALEKMGHRLTERSSIGRVDAILISSEGIRNAGADPRGDDVAVGW